MKRFAVIAAVAIAALGWAGTAFAGAPDGLAGPWADYVVASNEGCAFVPPDMTTCRPVPPVRTNPQAAVGPAESPAGPNQNIPEGSFFSIGFTDPSKGTAFITLGFANPICNVPGPLDLAVDVFEITQEPYPDEAVQVFVSADNVNYFFAGTVTKDGTVALPPQVPVANFVKLVDATNRQLFVNTPIIADGFDVDGVRAISTTRCPGGDFGKLEICKSSANGMSGKNFQFSLNGGTPISVRGGRCTGAINAIAGANTVVELQSNPPTDVTNITTRPSSRLIFADLPNRTGVVFVPPGSTAANETMVTFTNEPAGGTVGDLKICKLSQAPAYWGRSFSFRVNGGPLFSTTANPASSDPSTWSCRIVGSFQTGSVVTVQEAIPTGAEVDFIDTDPGANLVDLNTDTGTARVLVTGPVTTVLFDNEPIPPPQAGYIEVCKDAALVGGSPDPFVVGPFDFTISPPDGNSFDVTTFAGQCTEPFRVAAGIVRVTEHAKANHTLVDAFPEPVDRFVDVNLINRTLDVEVPVSDSANNETQVHFVNRRDRSQLKVCKLLGPNSDALAGQTFNFTVTSAGFAPQSPSVTAGAAPACVIVGDYPIGNDVTVVENLDHGVNQPGEFIDTTGGGTITIQPGTTNEVDVTNTARGVLEVCKARIDYLTGTQPTFRFRVDGGGLFTVQAGACSPKLRVSPGTHTVTELSESDYELLSITASPPDRLLLADIPNRTATVSVPYAGNGNGETAVTFTNQVRQGRVKVCKVAPPTSSFAAPFTYSVYVQAANGTFPPPMVLGPIVANGDCSAFTPFFPILNANGTKKVVGVVENGTGPASPWVVTDISVTGSRGLCTNAATSCVPTGKDLSLGIIDFYLGPDANTVTYTNQAR